MIEIADDPRYRAVAGIENTTASQWLSPPDQVSVPSMRYQLISALIAPSHTQPTCRILT